MIDKSDIPPTLVEVSDKVRLASTTVSDIIHRLQRNGLLIREQDPLDARAIRLRITGEAWESLELSVDGVDCTTRKEFNNAK